VPIPTTKPCASAAYEIMDKSGQREIYIDGPAAELFRKDVQELIASEAHHGRHRQLPEPLLT
jgi:hypothetical protein